MAALVSQLEIPLPFGAFNGGSLVGPDRSLIVAHRLPSAVAQRILDLFATSGVDVWVYADGDWLVRRPTAANEARERQALGFEPKVRDRFADVIGRIDKIVAVSADPALLSRVELHARALAGGAAYIQLSQPGHLDVTHPAANKGDAVSALGERLGLDLRHAAVIGDSFNDVPMFARAGFSIAMGQAPAEVKTQADAVTLSNTDDGFANAVDRLILPFAAVARRRRWRGGAGPPAAPTIENETV
jgi:Cof subfamily protein (haloacid dehalogenase superfamily)